MDRSFTQRSDGLEDGEINGSVVKEDSTGNSYYAVKDSPKGSDTDLTVIPMHSFSNVDDSVLEVIALHPESGQQLDDETTPASYLVDGKCCLPLK